MRMFRCYSLLLVVFCAAFSGTPRMASAAPFCVQIRGMTPQCIYVDPGQCRERARQLEGVCTSNPDELKLVPGSQRFCLVNASRAALCIYSDMQTCDGVAGREKDAVCVDSGATETVAGQPEEANAPGQQLKPQPEQDPYRFDPGRRY